MRIPRGTFIARTYFARGAVLWASARALLSAVFILGHTDPLRLSFGSIIFVMAAVSGVGIADLDRRHERPLLANLGLSRATQISFFALPALLGEMVIAMVAMMQS